MITSICIVTATQRSVKQLNGGLLYNHATKHDPGYTVCIEVQKNPPEMRAPQ